MGTACLRIFLIRFTLFLVSIKYRRHMLHHLIRKVRNIINHPSHWRAIIACKYGEPLHYHHDGCPACFAAWNYGVPSARTH